MRTASQERTARPPEAAWEPLTPGLAVPRAGIPGKQEHGHSSLQERQDPAPLLLMQTSAQAPQSWMHRHNRLLQTRTPFCWWEKEVLLPRRAATASIFHSVAVLQNLPLKWLCHL